MEQRIQSCRSRKEGSSLVKGALKLGPVQGLLPCDPQGWEESPAAGVGGHELTSSAPEWEARCSPERGQGRGGKGWEGPEEAGGGVSSRSWAASVRRGQGLRARPVEARARAWWWTVSFLLSLTPLLAA